MTEAERRTPTHDPLRSLNDLRDHLASHDKPIAFLFGAGTSCSAKRRDSTEPLIPAVAAMTTLSRDAVGALGEQFATAWTRTVGALTQDDREPNIEDILSRVRLMLDAIAHGDKLVGLSLEELERMETCIRTTIARLANPPEEAMPDTLPHDEFAKWVARIQRKQPVEIFTTNYDILFERALEGQRVKVFDGFVGSYEPFFAPDSLRATSASDDWTKVWKIHGSVNWQWENRFEQRHIVRRLPTNTGEMILPSHYKYDESRKQPYLALLERLGRFLSNSDALLIAVGSSFNDEHINSVIFDALDQSQRSHLISLQYADLPEEHQLVRRAARRANIWVCGPTVATIKCRRAPWSSLDQSDEQAMSLAAVAFEASTTDQGETPIDAGATDEVAPPPDDGSNAADPDDAALRLTLGDFSHFCSFVATLEQGHSEY